VNERDWSKVTSLPLIELHPRWMRLTAPGTSMQYTDTLDISNAHGIRFLCPKCMVTNRGEVGVHQVVCWANNRGVPADLQPGPGRWLFLGTGFNDLSFSNPPGIKVSVQITSGCCWHGIISVGEVSILPG
jgi:hypothetical protein